MHESHRWSCHWPYCSLDDLISGLVSGHTAHDVLPYLMSKLVDDLISSLVTGHIYLDRLRCLVWWVNVNLFSTPAFTPYLKKQNACWLCENNTGTKRGGKMRWEGGRSQDSEKQTHKVCVIGWMDLLSGLQVLALMLLISCGALSDELYIIWWMNLISGLITGLTALDQLRCPARWAIYNLMNEPRQWSNHWPYCSWWAPFFWRVMWWMNFTNGLVTGLNAAYCFVASIWLHMLPPHPALDEPQS